MKKIEIILDGKDAEKLEAAITKFVSGLFDGAGWEGNALSVRTAPAGRRDIIIPDFLKRKAVGT